MLCYLESVFIKKYLLLFVVRCYRKVLYKYKDMELKEKF